MKKLIMMLSAVVAAVTSAWAAPTPDVVIESFTDDMTVTGASGAVYTLTLGEGNSIENGIITIGENAVAGAKLTADKALSTKMTVIAKYSNLSMPSDISKEVISILSKSDVQCVGARFRGNNTSDLVALSENGNKSTNFFFSSGGGGADNSSPDPTAAGFLMLSYQCDAGTACFAGESLNRLTGGYLTGLKYSNRSIWGCAVGGPYTDSAFPVCAGMKIEKIAIFLGQYHTGTAVTAYSDYVWPSEFGEISISGNTSISAIKSVIPEGKKNVDVTVEAGAEIAIDDTEAFAIDVKIVSTGSVTLTATEKPANLPGKLSFAGVAGAVKRSWLETPGVVGFNFNANGKQANGGTEDGCADTSLALEIGTWYKNAADASGSSTELIADGFSTLTWSSKNLWAERDGITGGTFIQGYLDDGGSQAHISLSNIPYETYDLIVYCSTDTSSAKFKAVNVNGTLYTWDAAQSKVVVTTDANATWGLASAAAGKAVIGANTIRINNLTGPLSIAGGTNDNGARGCIAAVQVMPAGTSTAPTMTLTASADWSDTTKWANGTVATVNAIIKVTGDVTLAIPESVALTGGITVEGTGTLTIVPASGKTFAASSISSAVPVSFGEGISIPTISAAVTYLTKTTTLESSLLGATYTKGAGSPAVDEENPGTFVQIKQKGGSITLKSETADDVYYVREDFDGAKTTVTMTDTKVVYSDVMGIGDMTYVIDGATTIAAPRFILSQGGASRTSEVTVGDTAAITVTGSNNVDSNQASIMFGHWDGPSTFTLKDSASFTATDAWVLVGKTGNTQIININGGTFTTKGIKLAGYASNNNQLNLAGGNLVLGSEGITANGGSMAINVTGSATITTVADTSITQTISGEGALTKAGAGVLAIGASRPKLAAIEGGIKLEVTVDEFSAGKIVLPTTMTEAPAEGLITVTRGSDTIEISAMAINDSNLEISLEVNSAITADSKVSEWTATTGVVTVDGSAVEAPIVLDFDTTLPEGITGVMLLGKVKLVGTIPVEKLQITGGTELYIAAPINASLPSGITATLCDSISGDVTLSGAATYKAQDGASITGTVNFTGNALTLEGTLTINNTRESVIRGIKGGTLAKQGSGMLKINNGVNNGHDNSGNLAVDGSTVKVQAGMVKMYLTNGDANLYNPTFVIGENGELENYGWFTVIGTITLESDYDKTVFTNTDTLQHAGGGVQMKGSPAIVKNGSGRVNLGCGSNSNAQLKYGAVTINEGTLAFSSSNTKVFGAAVTGAGNIEQAGGGAMTFEAANNLTGKVIVSAGKLDLGSAVPTTPYDVVLKGGYIKGAFGNAHVAVIGKLTLEGDSAIGSESDKSGILGLGTGSAGASTLALGGHTLSVWGEGNVYLESTTVTSAGTIEVKSGNLLTHCGNIAMPAGSTINVAEGASIEIDENKTLSVDNMALSGTATGKGTWHITVNTSFEGTAVDGHMTVPSTGPTSWDEVEDVAEVLPEGTTTTITATEIAAWASDNGVAFEQGITIPVNALILNCAPEAIPANVEEVADAALKQIATDLDLVALMKEAVEKGGSVTIPAVTGENPYPYAVFKLVPSTKLKSTGSAKFFQLTIELK